MSIAACVHFETDVAGGFKGCIIKTVKKKRIKNKSFAQEAALSQMSIYAQKKKKKSSSASTVCYK